MKNLLQYILEATNKFTPTETWLKENYDKFNEELFNTELPSSKDIKLSVARTKGSELGCQGFEKTFYFSSEFMENGMYRMRVLKPGKYIGLSSYWKNGRRHTEYIADDENTTPVKSCLELKPFININAIYVATEHNLEDTLIHEMVHLWVSKDGLEPKQAHGKEFKKKCNEIRKLAKEKYGIEYELTTKASNYDEFEEDDKKKKETEQIIQKNKKRGGGVLGVFILLDDKVKTETSLPYSERFFFCTKSKLNSLLREVKYYDGKYIKHIYVTEDSYEKLCNIYGIFKIINRYRFWDTNNYTKAREIMVKNATDVFNESLNEDKKPYIKPEIFMYQIPANTNLSDIDLEDIVNVKIENNEMETKNSPENEKNMITPKK